MSLGGLSEHGVITSTPIGLGWGGVEISTQNQSWRGCYQCLMMTTLVLILSF
jgi:hypothetical protein